MSFNLTLANPRRSTYNVRVCWRYKKYNLVYIHNFLKSFITCFELANPQSLVLLLDKNKIIFSDCSLLQFLQYIVTWVRRCLCWVGPIRLNEGMKEALILPDDSSLQRVLSLGMSEKVSRKFGRFKQLFINHSTKYTLRSHEVRG